MQRPRRRRAYRRDDRRKRPTARVGGYARPDIGGLIGAAATVAVGFLVTRSLTAAAKQTDVMVAFAKRFGEICEHQEAFNDSFERLDTLGEIQERRAQRIYREYFTLLFDEFYAFQKGFLDADVFSLWMTKWDTTLRRRGVTTMCGVS